VDDPPLESRGLAPAHQPPFPSASTSDRASHVAALLRNDVHPSSGETHVTKYRDLVTEAGAEVLDCQMRGKRRLAYPIAKHKEGIYVQLAHNGDGQQVATLEKAMRISEDVIRYLTVKQDGPLPAPRSGPVPQATSDAAALQTSEA